MLESTDFALDMNWFFGFVASTSEGALSFNGRFSTVSFCKVNFWAPGNRFPTFPSNLLSCIFSSNFDESTVSMLRSACPLNIEGDNFIGDMSFAVDSLDSDDFSLGETNLSSCWSIFDAISLDFVGKAGKLVPGLLSFTFSSIRVGF